MPTDQDLTPDARALKLQCLSIDLEVSRKSSIIHQLAARRGDNGEQLTYPPGALPQTLDVLEQLAANAAFLLGHDLIAFDLAQLRAVQPNLQVLNKPVIDILHLNPLALPKNPCHHLVKHYAELALQVFCDQEASLKQMQQTNSDLLLACPRERTQGAGSPPTGHERRT